MTLLGSIRALGQGLSKRGRYMFLGWPICVLAFSGSAWAQEGPSPQAQEWSPQDRVEALQKELSLNTNTMSAELRARKSIELASTRFAMLGLGSSRSEIPERSQVDRILRLYSESLPLLSREEQGSAVRQMAWCYFHLGEPKQAIKILVQEMGIAERFSRVSLEPKSGATPLPPQPEVARDLAIFMARSDFGAVQIQVLAGLAGEHHALEVLQLLAQESEGFAKPENAIRAWEAVLATEISPERRVETQLHLARYLFGLKQNLFALKQFAAALETWQALSGCSDEACSRLKAGFGDFVERWRVRDQAQGPSPELLSLFANYLRVFNRDYDNRVLAARIAEDRSEFVVAINWLTEAADIAAREAGKSGLGRDQWAIALEQVLLREVAVATASGSVDNLERAYINYLNKTMRREKYHQLRFEQAQLQERNGFHFSAAESYHQLARDPEAPEDLRLRAGRRSLAAAQNSGSLDFMETWAREYILMFPTQAEEFQRQARAAVLEQVARLTGANPDRGVASEDSSPTGDLVAGALLALTPQLSEAWSLLDRVDLEHATQPEKARYFRSRMTVAEGLHDFGEARRAVEGLIDVTQPQSAEQNSAWLRKAWFAELDLDFAGALVAKEKVSHSRELDKSQWLQMALLADLAGKESEEYYRRFFAAQPNQDDALVAIEQKFIMAQEPTMQLKVLQHYRGLLKRSPEVYSRLLLRYLSAAEDYQFVSSEVEHTPGLTKTPSGREIHRYLVMHKFKPMIEELKTLPMKAGTEANLERSLRERKALLEKMESVTQVEEVSSDWTARIWLLTHLANEAQRFYDEASNLPPPEGATTEQQKVFVSLVKEFAQPFVAVAERARSRAQQLKAKVDLVGMWSQIYQESGAEVRNLVNFALDEIRPIVSEAERRQLMALSLRPRSSASIPSQSEVEQARQEVRQNPLYRPALERLKELEARSGRAAMVHYLQVRLERLDP